ncbi:MAG: hypothetical protein HY319_14390 [Armatimonadetes bacterium]|nr:hypothetical protein [Armatimonadota bacterium]
MPRCSWCGEFTRDAERLEDGRAVITLCPLCAAEKRLRENPELSLEELTRPPSVWERIRRFFKRR